ncbi:hypothetical protein EVAR_11072_1 [Eumeta japonica]|uniref:Uncharacterized protein n=1 Tax=Eumeta variegata TaxID=151549 RepID=A0A4C1U414_EUMVA|nr:hypothetical protein EVAR_11072_1 [Eumeta japonica]
MSRQWQREAALGRAASRGRRVEPARCDEPVDVADKGARRARGDAPVPTPAVLNSVSFAKWSRAAVHVDLSLRTRRTARLEIADRADVAAHKIHDNTHLIGPDAAAAREEPSAMALTARPRRPAPRAPPEASLVYTRAGAGSDATP